MAVKHTPEHPVARDAILTVLRRRHALGDLDDLLSVVVLDRVIARDLDDIVPPDASPAADDIALLVSPQLLGRLLGRQHLDDLAPAVVDLLGHFPSCGEGPGVQTLVVDGDDAFWLVVVLGEGGGSGGGIDWGLHDGGVGRMGNRTAAIQCGRDAVFVKPRPDKNQPA